MMADGYIIGDGSWNLRVYVTDLQVERSLRVKGDLHIGGVMLRLVEDLVPYKLFLFGNYNIYRAKQDEGSSGQQSESTVPCHIPPFHYCFLELTLPSVPRAPPAAFCTGPNLTLPLSPLYDREQERRNSLLRDGAEFRYTGSSRQCKDEASSSSGSSCRHNRWQPEYGVLESAALDLTEYTFLSSLPLHCRHCLVSNLSTYNEANVCGAQSSQEYRSLELVAVPYLNHSNIQASKHSRSKTLDNSPSMYQNPTPLTLLGLQYIISCRRFSSSAFVWPNSLIWPREGKETGTGPGRMRWCARPRVRMNDGETPAVRCGWLGYPRARGF
ncbi:hypothetical protein J6590_071103 [Homalodisca vitripennis]|nr:hypothetical protein J6590_071103 [Homalodisca vitripennis]